MQVLLVDDSRATRFILGNMMKELGWKVVEACDGQNALEVLHGSDECNLALVDWNMPNMNGYELIQSLRSQPRHDEMKIMMVTTETESEQVIKALEAGANEYIMKPFTKEMIFEKLKLLGFDKNA